MARESTVLSDAAKTAVLREAVRDLHAQGDGNGAHSPLSASWALLDEVANVAGWPSGYADVIAFHLWPSRAAIVGYEIKASRADLKRELADLGKAERFARYCSEWRLVAWSREWLDGEKKVDGIPDDWGLYAWSPAKGALECVRKAARRPVAGELPLPFVAALVRRAVESGVGAAVLSEFCRRSAEAARHEGERAGRRAAMDSLAPLVARHNAAAMTYFARVRGTGPEEFAKLCAWLDARVAAAEAFEKAAAAPAEPIP